MNPTKNDITELFELAEQNQAAIERGMFTAEDRVNIDGQYVPIEKGYDQQEQPTDQSNDN